MINNLLKELQLLPYADMMSIARVLNEQLAAQAPDLPPVTKIANALAELAETRIESSPEATQEQKMLRAVFSRRRSISVATLNNGFVVEIQTLHARVLHTDLKSALGQVVDTVVVAHTLAGGK